MAVSLATGTETAVLCVRVRLCVYVCVRVSVLKVKTMESILTFMSDLALTLPR